ncbi:hypothetical protein KD050_14600 [Psychrobacillus sp. INOP01]|uniref:hypothetical protein n=1 Tax=Psychrobacillus sp. INOP01 TaxID=2829187 RepID=UPI001BA8316E|nr:hypothetical protein [Psychrobacillus sp. INOP01]QUG40519.1 hypothetical protein KD050_14600 [Psychrobacillus sp. INOP01]
MWKKVVPTVALCSFLLVGCNNANDDVVPETNETPMEDVRDDVNTLSPNTDNGMNDNGNGTLNDGTIDDGTNNNGTTNNGTMDGQPGINDNTNGTVPNDDKWIKEPSTELENDDDELINDKDNNMK